MKIIYRVSFYTPAPMNFQADFYFNSISAIYGKFTPEQIGAARQTLYQKRMKPGEEYRTAFCIIKKCELIKNQP